MKDTLGQGVLFFIERFPLFRGWNWGQVDLSFIERCSLFGVSFIGGSTVLTLRSVCAKHAFSPYTSCAYFRKFVILILLGGHYMEHRRVLFSNWLIAKHPPHSNAHTQEV